MATRNAFVNQIQNRNFLSSIGFKFSLARHPKVDFFSNSARIPEIQLGLASQPTYLKDIDIPGEKLTYGDLNLRFLVDENMENYMAVYNWLVGLGFPEEATQFKNQTTSVLARLMGFRSVSYLANCRRGQSCLLYTSPSPRDS